MKLRYIFAIIGALLPLLLLVDNQSISLLYAVLNPPAFLQFGFTVPNSCSHVWQDCPLHLVPNIVLSSLIYYMVGFYLERIFKKPVHNELERGNNSSQEVAKKESAPRSIVGSMVGIVMALLISISIIIVFIIFHL